jgi:hypothetical protein
MNWTVILLSAGLIAAIGITAWWFAGQEPTATGSGEDLDPHTREAMRESSIRITNVGGGASDAGV